TGGMYLRSNGVGTFSIISGQDTRLVSSSEVVHSTPRSASAGFVTFQVKWTAPQAAGGVDLSVSGLSANGNGGSNGDNYGTATLSLVFGCAGTTYFRDMDGDGVGSSASGTTKNCAVPAGYSATDGDCNENDQNVFPGHPELCNGKDDNCNGQADEGLANVTMYPDGDGDGYGRAGGNTVTGCTNANGYAPNDTDCDDTDANVHPGGSEVCNLKDDDCDGTVDEGARVICGVGMCRRYGPTCDPAMCVPGTPTTEQCNALDDDCDGVDDNGSADMCATGQNCNAGVCTGTIDTSGGNGGGAGGGGGVATSSGGCSASAMVPGVITLLGVGGLIRRRAKWRS
ncbi:MAG: putative metal-binding motif-containing protein, partial [Myxococcaceae bacterium]